MTKQATQGSMFKFGLIAASIFLLTRFASAAVDDPTISPPPKFSKQQLADLVALKKMIARQSGCSQSPFKTQIETLIYSDFYRNGSKGLVVDASTCNTGTAGPDIHSVFFRNGKGEFEEYPVPNADRKYYENLEGNRNYRLSVEGGLLVATWHDKPDKGPSARDERLIVRYRWNGKKFLVASVVDAH